MTLGIDQQPSGRRAGFRGNPFWLFGPRPVREARLRGYVHRQHRGGRPLSEILLDRRLDELGGRTLVWRVLMSPVMIRALGEDTCEQMRRCMEIGERLGRTGV